MRAASATIAPCRDKPGARVPSVSCRPFADSQQHRTNTDIPIHRALPKVTVRNANAVLAPTGFLTGRYYITDSWSSLLLALGLGRLAALKLSCGRL
jgi:hypothetical protein